MTIRVTFTDRESASVPSGARTRSCRVVDPAGTDRPGSRLLVATRRQLGRGFRCQVGVAEEFEDIPKLVPVLALIVWAGRALQAAKSPSRRRWSLSAQPGLVGPCLGLADGPARGMVRPPRSDPGSRQGGPARPHHLHDEDRCADRRSARGAGIGVQPVNQRGRYQHQIIRVKGRNRVRIKTKSRAGERVLVMPSWCTQMVRTRLMNGARLDQPLCADGRGGFRDPANVRRDLRWARSPVGVSCVRNLAGGCETFAVALDSPRRMSRNAWGASNHDRA